MYGFTTEQSLFDCEQWQTVACCDDPQYAEECGDHPCSYVWKLHRSHFDWSAIPPQIETKCPGCGDEVVITGSLERSPTAFVVTVEYGADLAWQRSRRGYSPVKVDDWSTVGTVE